MDGERPRVRMVREIGYRVLMRNADGTPRQVLRCFVKEGEYGRFLSIERHWVQRMEGEEIVESKWAGRVINFPCDRRRALAMLNSIRELVEASFAFEDETHRYGDTE
nr:hypothetical protein [Methanophagales archaeon]